MRAFWTLPRAGLTVWVTVALLTSPASAQIGHRTALPSPDATAAGRGATIATGPRTGARTVVRTRPTRMALHAGPGRLASRRLAPFFGPLFGAPALWWGGDWPESAVDEDSPEPATTPSAYAVTTPVPRAPYAGPSSIQPLVPSQAARSSAVASSSGTLRLDVQPADAQVYVDGFFAGSVDTLNDRGGLVASAGWHRLEFRAPGHQTPAVNVTVESGRVASVHLALRPLP